MGHAILPVSMELFESLFQLPEGYRMITAQPDMIRKEIAFLISSAEIPETPPYCEFPRMQLHVKQETYPDAPPEYRKITIMPKVEGIENGNQ